MKTVLWLGTSYLAANLSCAVVKFENYFLGIGLSVYHYAYGSANLLRIRINGKLCCWKQQYLRNTEQCAK